MNENDHWHVCALGIQKWFEVTWDEWIWFFAGFMAILWGKACQSLPTMHHRFVFLVPSVNQTCQKSKGQKFFSKSVVTMERGQWDSNWPTWCGPFLFCRAESHVTFLWLFVPHKTVEAKALSISIAQAHLELCAVLRSIATGAAWCRWLTGWHGIDGRMKKAGASAQWIPGPQASIETPIHDLHDPCIPIAPFFGFLTFQRPGLISTYINTDNRSGPNLDFRCGMLVGAVIVCCPCWWIW